MAEKNTALEQSAQAEQPETKVPDAGTKEPDNAAKVDKKVYPERPYEDAISPEHKKFLADREKARKESTEK